MNARLFRFAFPVLAAVISGCGVPGAALPDPDITTMRITLEEDGKTRVFLPGIAAALVDGVLVRLKQPLAWNAVPPQTYAAAAGAAPKAPPLTPVRLPDANPEAAWSRIRGSREWRFIVIHHSGTEAGNAASFGRYHQEHNGWKSLGYHFVIGNGHGSPDGEVEVGPRWTAQEQGAHAGVSLYNAQGIGVCLVGNFERSRPTPAQIASLERLIAFLATAHRIPASGVIGHRDCLKTTACPGRLFPLAEVKRWAREGMR